MVSEVYQSVSISTADADRDLISCRFSKSLLLHFEIHLQMPIHTCRTLFLPLINAEKYLAPKTEVLQAANQTFHPLKTFDGCKINSKAAAQIRDLVLTKSPNDQPDNNVQTLIKSGLLSPSFLQDMRKLNSWGGKGDGYTSFCIFYDRCRSILRTNAGAHERRKVSNDDVL
mmetsp:Transcript_2704/g.3961  ORF Transcript_2704/g.3961 Transcript_2704/m.3961 type:complete len:171 (+) Transcript_2704:243-755(+)